MPRRAQPGDDSDDRRANVACVVEHLERKGVLALADGDALVARIEGKRGGADASEEWRFTRAR